MLDVGCCCWLGVLLRCSQPPSVVSPCLSKVPTPFHLLFFCACGNGEQSTREIAAIIKVCIVLCYSSYSFKSNLKVLVP